MERLTNPQLPRHQFGPPEDYVLELSPSDLELPISLSHGQDNIIVLLLLGNILLLEYQT